jgi:hypothetical protein
MPTPSSDAIPSASPQLHHTSCPPEGSRNNNWEDYNVEETELHGTRNIDFQRRASIAESTSSLPVLLHERSLSKDITAKLAIPDGPVGKEFRDNQSLQCECIYSL